MSGYTTADAVSDLEWVERRIGEMESDGGWHESIVKYRACAEELRALIESDTYRTGRAV